MRITVQVWLNISHGCCLGAHKYVCVSLHNWATLMKLWSVCWTTIILHKLHIFSVVRLNRTVTWVLWESSRKEKKKKTSAIITVQETLTTSQCGVVELTLCTHKVTFSRHWAASLCKHSHQLLNCLFHKECNYKHHKVFMSQWYDLM